MFSLLEYSLEPGGLSLGSRIKQKGRRLDARGPWKFFFVYLSFGYNASLPCPRASVNQYQKYR